MDVSSDLGKNRDNVRGGVGKEPDQRPLENCQGGCKERDLGILLTGSWQFQKEVDVEIVRLVALG